MSQTEVVRKYITELLVSKKAAGLKFVDIRSGDIHTDLNMSNRFPIVCSAMTSLHLFQYEIIKSPTGGQGSNFILRYFLDDN